MQRQNVIVILLCLMLIGALACSGQAQKGEDATYLQKEGDATHSDWQLVDAGTFTIFLPPKWQFNKIQGTDSQVGEFVGGAMHLRFDFGWYSDPLRVHSNGHIVSDEIIDGHSAKLVVSKGGEGITGVHFEDLGNHNKLSIAGYNLNPSQQQTALAIFRTIQFKPK